MSADPKPETVEPCDHAWEFIDDSFDHEFGTEIVTCDRCEKCGAERPHERQYFPDDVS